MSHLTRAQALELLSANARFMSFLKDFKAAQGYSPEAVHFLDDHKRNFDDAHHLSRCTDFIAVLRVHADGTPIDETHRPAMWIFPGFTDRDWRSTQTQNPLCAGEDGHIHLSTCSRGSTLNAGLNFTRKVREEQGVHLTDMSDYDGDEDYEAHIHLTVAQLAAL
jgi:hypothetical protein